MRVIVGLGNPGITYEKTRHNAGFMALDKIASKNNFSFDEKAKFKSQLFRRDDDFFVKPTTFMNKSGEAVQSLFSFYKIDCGTETVPQLFVLHDDLDISLGQWKVQYGTGPKVHNGVQSLYDALGTQNFIHVRIGIDSRNGDRSIPGKDYVLQPFSQEEREELDIALEEIVSYLQKTYDI